MLTIDMKSYFVQARQCVYLDTAAEGLPLAQCRDGLEAYFDDKSRGTPGRRLLHENENAALCATARLLSTDPDNVALVSSTSDALNAFSNSIEWQPGDEVVTTDLEFPSGVYAWLRLRNRGVRVRVIESQDGALFLDSFAAVICPATRVVCLSHVSYKSGTRIPFLRELSELAHRYGALLVIDATQSLGRIPVPVEAVDFLVASSYKWLLGIHGLAVTYLAPAAREPVANGAVGWYSVVDLFSEDRFEKYEKKPGAGWMMCGMPNFPAMYALRHSIEFLLNQDVARIHRSLSPLVDALRQGIARAGLDLLTPAGEEYASGIVSFRHPAFEQIGAALQREGIVVWSGDGRVRASVHLYNDADDVNRFLSALESAHKDSVCKSHFSAD